MSETYQSTCTKNLGNFTDFKILQNEGSTFSITKTCEEGTAKVT